MSRMPFLSPTISVKALKEHKALTLTSGLASSFLCLTQNLDGRYIAPFAMIVWRVRWKIIRSVLSSSVQQLCTVQCTHMNEPNSCLLIRFSFSVSKLCYSLSVLDLAFWDYYPTIQ